MHQALLSRTNHVCSNSWSHRSQISALCPAVKAVRHEGALCHVREQVIKVVGSLAAATVLLNGAGSDALAAGINLQADPVVS